MSDEIIDYVAFTSKNQFVTYFPEIRDAVANRNPFFISTPDIPGSVKMIVDLLPDGLIMQEHGSSRTLREQVSFEHLNYFGYVTNTGGLAKRLALPVLRPGMIGVPIDVARRATCNGPTQTHYSSQTLHDNQLLLELVALLWDTHLEAIASNEMNLNTIINKLTVLSKKLDDCRLYCSTAVIPYPRELEEAMHGVMCKQIKNLIPHIRRLYSMPVVEMVDLPEDLLFEQEFEAPAAPE